MTLASWVPRRLSILAAITLLAAGACPATAAASSDVAERTTAATLSAADEAYLRGVMADTWACIAHFVEPSTGLPYDTSERGEYSSVTNLGYYAASCAVAAEVGLAERADAVKRVRRVLESYRQFEHWKGFSQSWNSVKTRQPAPHDTMISLLDSANMVAGFVVAGRLLPELAGDVDAILQGLDWSAFHDPDDGRLFGGYDLKRRQIDPGWHIGDYAGDGRMAAFWAIAVQAAPPESWQRLTRETESHYGLTILRPAWLGGGLFMQVQDGLFLDERSTPAGRSAADFAYAQMLYAKDLDLPVWGWSASFAPDGRYLGWGGLEVPVVTPHAPGMAAMYYPHKAADCLRELERRGVRAPFDDAGKKLKLGFRDSIDLRDGSVSKLYVPMLDQAMMFLSLANLLDDRVVQRAFHAHPTVQRGCKLLPEYGQPVDVAWLKELGRRDAAPLRLPSPAQAKGPAPVPVDDFEDATENQNAAGGRNSTWTRDKDDATVTVKLSECPGAEADRPGRCLRVDYDVDSPNPAFGGLNFDLEGADASGCDALVFWTRGTPARCKVELHGAGGSGSTYLQNIDPGKWTRHEVPLRDFGGMITDWRKLSRLVFVIEDGVARPKTGALWLDDITFVKASKPTS